MNLNQVSIASAAVMAVVGALRNRRTDYADAVMKRPLAGVTADFVETSREEPQRRRLADLAVLLDLMEHLEHEIGTETGVGAQARLRGKLRGLQAVAKAEPEDVLGRVRFGRYGQWFPIPQPVTEAKLWKRARIAVDERRLPPQILELVFEPAVSLRSGKKRRAGASLQGDGVHREATTA